MALDATALLEPLAGVGVVVDALVDALHARSDVDLTTFAISGRRGRRLTRRVPRGVPAVRVPYAARAVRPSWARWDRPGIDLFVDDVDVVHGPNFVVPPTSHARLLTIHDLTPWRFPELCDRWTLDYPALVRRAVGAGAWIHTVSDAVRDEVVGELDVDPDRVVAVRNGFAPSPGEANRGRRLVGTDRYVLAVGTVEPRKGLPTLAAAVDQLVDTHPDLHLVHAGGDGWGLDELNDALSRMRHPDRFQRLGRVGDRALADLYRGATVFAYPSRYEGFGLPVLEAMDAGTPVVTTDLPAIREVAGDAADLVPVGDVDALASALARCWTDDDHAEERRAAGRHRVTLFSWEQTAAGLVDLYRRVRDAH